MPIAMNVVYNILISTTNSRYSSRDDFMFQMMSSYTTSVLKYQYQKMSGESNPSAYAVFLIIGK